MRKTVIVSGARTPFGKFGGSLKSFTASQLGGKAIEEALKRAQMDGEQIDEVIMGTVLQGGQGQIPSRQAAREAGIPWHVKTETINKVCASGLRSVTLADQLIRLGDEEVIVAGGMESMSNAPYFLPDARWGNRMGDKTVKDMMIHDGLTCSFKGVHMGNYGNSTAEEYELTREAQDEWSYRSHQRAGEAIETGKFAEEIVPLEVPQRKGDPIVVDTDEAPRKDTSVEKLAKLKPAFDPNGTITAGNAPGVNDGACAFVVMSDEKARELGKEPMATVLGHAEVAVEAKDFPQTPGLVINKLLEKTGHKKEDIDLFEINEAFAAVSLASGKIAGIDQEKVNVNGGAVALGHPIGASGARIILTLIHELKRRGGGLGIAAICSGGGQGDAVLIEVSKQ
ncbi:MULTISPECIES: acetyl-CoA C-acetyltransferase [Virgibacillus]|uniref:acetyl-CoA C-acetyltransferase n=1 Tax=Virgibacillus halodenitrificans TaxID=1482 RepID=A0AAC9NM59_VIRHA|nr:MULTISPECIES: acetyl-CoA C-acetyltransferase [Virgibacillus]AIF44697.1 acetyl-CoA acetyltransferase [Virgibacillus sp. SK37]APC49780.1 acetyl-CoA acetyltransferase [Virgibacillus halodenitrificans]MBD1221511.1 acetyl-CoA C-acetyltransferase [Virgibacillus halodenitrificans]MYL45485.1 acetyl-CoA C-acetyltransferase [Virgibacillus halodenitrificans]MYL57320.1 acetyl-CoA C-acetyltransferase [Virgibacillus halodenitrificans]